MPSHTELVKLISSEKWKNRFACLGLTYLTCSAEFYYDIICGLTDEIDLWETRYFHVMNTHADIVKWFSGTALRPYLDCLEDTSEFLAAYENALKEAYPVQPDGKILFPFTRIFFTVKKDSCSNL
jgi:trans-aconitate 2-methyltransferase